MVGDLLQSLKVDGGGTSWIERDYYADRDVLKSIEARWGGTTRIRYEYAVNSRGERTSVIQSGAAFADYGNGGSDPGTGFRLFSYDSRGQLVGDIGYLGSNLADTSRFLPGRRHTFDYDLIGSRLWSDRSGEDTLRDNYNVLIDSGSSAETAERELKMKLNQYHSRENSTVTFAGTAAPGPNPPAAPAVGETTVTVQGGSLAPLRASRQGRFWSSEVVVNNDPYPWWGPLTVASAWRGSSGAADLFRYDSRMAAQPAFRQKFQYDLDGNLTDDGIWTYTWDAENRLIRMQTTAAALALTAPWRPFPGRRVDFTYDYLGRRVAKRVYDLDENREISSRRFAYDGWNVIAEYAAPGGNSLGALLRTYTWGLDIARTLADAGGVGALLQLVDHTASRTYLAAYDGNGNVTALLNPDSGALAAVYEYGPFGEALRAEATDEFAASQPFRFSTKWTDFETGLLYYGRRYYSPSQGRFLGRDPKDEKGGLNLYGFLLNNSINRWDYLGMEPDYRPTEVDIIETVFETGPGGQTWLVTYISERSAYQDSEQIENFEWREVSRRDINPVPRGDAGVEIDPSTPSNSSITVGVISAFASTCTDLYNRHSAIVNPLIGRGHYTTVGTALAGGYLLMGATARNPDFEYAFGVVSMLGVFDATSITVNTTGHFYLTPIVTSNQTLGVNLGHYLTNQMALSPVNTTGTNANGDASQTFTSALVAWGHNHPAGVPPGFSGNAGDRGFGAKWNALSSVTLDFASIRTGWRDQRAVSSANRDTDGDLSSVISSQDMRMLGTCLQSAPPRGFRAPAPAVTPP